MAPMPQKSGGQTKPSPGLILPFRIRRDLYGLPDPKRHATWMQGVCPDAPRPGTLALDHAVHSRYFCLHRRRR